MKCDTPKTVPFDDACREFVAFLASQGSPTSLRWFCREDVTAYRRRVRVLASTPDANRALYERYYRYGVSRGLGLRLEATFFTEATSWCQVWCPQDEVDASQAMMGGSLHYSVSFTPTARHDSQQLATRALARVGYIAWSVSFSGFRAATELVTDIDDMRNLPNHTLLTGQRAPVAVRAPSWPGPLSCLR